MNLFMQENGGPKGREYRPGSPSINYKTVPPLPIFEDTESVEGREEKLLDCATSTKNNPHHHTSSIGMKPEALWKCDHQPPDSATPRYVSFSHLGSQFQFDNFEPTYETNYTPYSSPLDKRVSFTMATPTSETYRALAGASFKDSRGASLSMASLQLEDEVRKDLDHKPVHRDGPANIQNNAVLSPAQKSLSTPSQAGPLQLESVFLDNRFQESLILDTEHDSGEERRTSDHILDVIQMPPESSVNWEAPPLRAWALAIVRQVLVEDDISALSPFDTQWAWTFKSHAGHRSSASNSTATSKSTGNSTSNSPSSNHSRKRSREDGDDELGDGDNEPPGRSKADPHESRERRDSLKLACPFRKYNAEKYNLKDHRICALKPWDSIMRVKEHIKRCHKAPIYCVRCKKTFESSETLKLHLAVEPSRICAFRDNPGPEGVTPEMERDLSGRWRAATPEELWIKIYQMLFPGARIPEPYFDPIQDIATPSDQNSSMQSVTRLSLLKIQRAISARLPEIVKIFPEHTKSQLISVIREEFHNPANRDSEEDSNMPPEPQRSTPKSQFLPLDTLACHAVTSTALHEVAQDELGKTLSKCSRRNGDGRDDMTQEGMLILTSTELVPAPAEPHSPDVNVDNCFCSGKCECPPRARISSMLRDFEFGQSYTDAFMFKDYGAEPPDMHDYGY